MTNERGGRSQSSWIMRGRQALVSTGIQFSIIPFEAWNVQDHGGVSCESVSQLTNQFICRSIILSINYYYYSILLDFFSPD